MDEKYWLMKTEPDTYSFEELVDKRDRTDRWEGVRNYQARNFMRDQFSLGDKVLVYHSRSGDPGIVGVAEVVKAAYPDPTALDPESPYFDPASAKSGHSRWVMVDIKATHRARELLSLKQLKQDKNLSGMALLKPGQRLSVQPVSRSEWEYIMSLLSLEAL